ncbi:hypothetical protein ACFXHA_43340 [Nocardia sp. NPDC059240]|uniref:hypothetical protein n=1 Tax=Nocardia sp. NPDC059240 TaxID=3346786 RepID=UPI003694754E
MSILQPHHHLPVPPRRRGGRPRTTDPDQLPVWLPDPVRALVAALNELLNRAELTAEQVARHQNLKLNSQQFHDRMIRKSGPPYELYTAILSASAASLDTTLDALHQQLKPLFDPVYLSGNDVLPPARPSATPVIDLPTQTRWLLRLLRNACEQEAIDGLAQRFHGNDTALASVLIDIAELDRFAVGLLLDAIAATDRPRAVAIRRAITERDEKAGAEIFEACNLSGHPDTPPGAAQPSPPANYDPDLGAGHRISGLLERRETTRVIREIAMRVERDEQASGKPQQSARRRTSTVLSRRTWRERPTCSRSFQQLIYGIALIDKHLDENARGPRRLADLLLALHEAGDLVSLSHCVTAFFDLREQYGKPAFRKPVYRAASKVFAHITTDVTLEILSQICTETRLDDEEDGEAAHADLEMLLWALDDAELTLMARNVAVMPRASGFSIGQFVAYLPNISSFWRCLVADQNGHTAGVLLGRAFSDWMAGDDGEIRSEDYPPLPWIAGALVDVDATIRMPRLSRHNAPVQSPVISMVKHLLADSPTAAVALLQAIMLDHHPRMRHFFEALIDDPEALRLLTGTVRITTTNTAPLHLFERLITELPETAGPICRGVAAIPPSSTDRVDADVLATVPTFWEALIAVAVESIQ